jgi:uncharacterized protein
VNLYRYQLDSLKSWKTRSNRKPLVIRGARQVGKTWLVRAFAEVEFEYFIEINFDETPKKRDLFSPEDTEKILQFISLDSGIPIVPGKTLLFLDEIQKAPEVFAKLRYFYEKRPDIHIISAGSLLDFILADHSFSMPVGRIEYMFMGPMSFPEYLKALGQEPLVDFIHGFSFEDTIPLPIHTNIIEHLRMYMCIGGMPSAAREYAENSSLSQCEIELSSILETLRDDVQKYQRKIDPEILRLILDKAPGLVGRKVKYSSISREIKSIYLKQGIRQFELARILHLVHHSSGNGIPLKSEKKERDFKLLFLDAGLMMHALGLSVLSLKDNALITINSGALAEQFIGQQWLNLHESHSNPELFYWNRQKSGSEAEVDYLFQIDDKILPVEVKAGTTGSLKSLHVFISEKGSPAAIRYNLEEPCLTTVTSRIPHAPKHTCRLLSLPLYLVSETKRLVRSL